MWHHPRAAEAQDRACEFSICLVLARNPKRMPITHGDKRILEIAIALAL